MKYPYTKFHQLNELEYFSFLSFRALSHTPFYFPIYEDKVIVNKFGIGISAE